MNKTSALSIILVLIIAGGLTYYLFTLQMSVDDLQERIHQIETKNQVQQSMDQLKTDIVKEFKKGDENEVIRRLQYILSQYPQIYPEGQVTGVYDDKTVLAVQKFQEKNDLKISGVLDEPTQNKLVETTCTPTSIPEELSQPRDGNENEILLLLNDEGKKFYAQSKAVRDTYSGNHPYKHFLLIGFSVDYMDQEGYFHPPAGRNCFVPNPDLYSDIPSIIPDKFYRYVKDCANKITIQRQVLDTTGGYMNYIGRDRYQEQCIDDGSFDNYYVESTKKLE
ncbi:MAG: peptidoglycan-binding domain-containing protein [Patescibacteria group bacterium]|jgi:peptidoglycan hydrolase-like protein with peptidoglycan-binding domain